MNWRQNLLWIDGLSGTAAGAFMLILAGPLSRWYGVEPGLLHFLAATNFLFASYSFTLARSRRRSLRSVQILAAANSAWGIACFGFAAYLAGAASPLGLGHFVFEGLYVGGLGVLEWRLRHTLAHQTT